MEEISVEDFLQACMVRTDTLEKGSCGLYIPYYMLKRYRQISGAVQRCVLHEDYAYVYLSRRQIFLYFKMSYVHFISKVGKIKTKEELEEFETDDIL